MIVVGVDPGKNRFASFFDHHEKLYTQVYKSEWGDDHGHNHHLVRSALEQPFFFNNKEEVVFFIEAPIVGMSRNYQTALSIAMTVGAMAATRYKTYIVPPAKWKKEMVGNGRATKPEVADWLASVKPGYLSACAGDQDLIDAAVISLYGKKVIANAQTVAAGGLTHL